MFKKIIGFATILASAGSALAAPSTIQSTDTISANGLSYVGNVTIANGDKHFSFRHSVFVDMPKVTGVYYSSLVKDRGHGDKWHNSNSTYHGDRGRNGTYHDDDHHFRRDGNSNDNNGNGKGNGTVNGASDGIIGLCYFPPFGTFRFPPTAWMAYFNTDTKAEIPEVSNDDGQVELEFSVKGAASVVATTFNKVEEIDKDGKVVNVIAFKNLTWVEGAHQNDSTGYLSWVTFSASQGNFKVDITLVVSKVVGKLNVGGATITPKSIESFIEMSGYEYANSENYLNFTAYVATASAKSVNAYEKTNTLIAGLGDSQVFLKFSPNAVVDGKVVDVVVDGHAAKDNIDPTNMENKLLKLQLETNSNLKVSTREIIVSFPKGASSISYDPSMGVVAPNSSSFVLPALFSILLAFIVLFF